MELDFNVIAGAVVLIVASVLVIAKAVASLTKTPKDDEIVGKIERIVRPILGVIQNLRPKFTKEQLAQAEDIRNFDKDGNPRIRYGTGDTIDPDRKREGAPKGADVSE